MPSEQFIWLDGKFVKFDDAKVHVLTHSLQYGSGIFEGIRCYDTQKGPAVFRLADHMKRFMRSLAVYGVKTRHTQKDFENAIKSLLSKNKLKEAYIRPFFFYKDVGIGFSAVGKTPSFAIAALPFGNMYNEPKGLHCKTSSWLRINSSTLPASAKASGNYINSMIASKEATDAGYDEAIMLSALGKVAEGPVDNIFLVEDDVLVTPQKSADILLGITRDTIIRIAKDSEMAVEERDVRREELYTADEVFFTGTATTVVPIVSVDSRPVGTGKIGPMSKTLLDRYMKVVHGQDNRYTAWLSYV